MIFPSLALGGILAVASTEEMTVSATDDPDLRRIDVEVSLDGSDRVLARLTGFVGKL